MPISHSAEKKAEIMRRHFAENLSESEVCGEYGIPERNILISEEEQ